jgi:hypothetical protein
LKQSSEFVDSLTFPSASLFSSLFTSVTLSRSLKTEGSKFCHSVLEDSIFDLLVVVFKAFELNDYFFLSKIDDFA